MLLCSVRWRKRCRVPLAVGVIGSLQVVFYRFVFHSLLFFMDSFLSEARKKWPSAGAVPAVASVAAKSAAAADTALPLYRQIRQTMVH